MMVLEMEFSWFDGRLDVEDTGIGSVEISKIFANQDDFFPQQNDSTNNTICDEFMVCEA